MLYKNSPIDAIIAAIKKPQSQIIQKKDSKKMFVEGEQLVTWLINNLSLNNRSEGIYVAQKLLDKGFIISKVKEFKDKRIAYDVAKEYVPNIQVYEKPLFREIKDKFNFLEISGEEIARQLTLIDSELFK